MMSRKKSLIWNRPIYSGTKGIATDKATELSISSVLVGRARRNQALQDSRLENHIPHI